MPVYIEQFQDTKKLFPDMIAVSKRGNFVYAIAIKMQGIRGQNDRTRIEYQMFIDLTNYPGHIPDVFITNIPDTQIRHINIYPPKGCAKLNGYYPFICLGNLKDALTRYRHLSAFLQGVKRILNNENWNDPARATPQQRREAMERLRRALF
ncbi:MAG: hypothetical protein HWN67_11265 [Candidatus Helarchaeota archaeon]|nr:hypothetical protein [Candidatus Helarchaeota archaeon]